MTVHENRMNVDEATARLETRPTQYFLHSPITEILMNSAILRVHAISQVCKHGELQLRVRGRSSAGNEGIF